MLVDTVNVYCCDKVLVALTSDVLDPVTVLLGEKLRVSFETVSNIVRVLPVSVTVRFMVPSSDADSVVLYVFVNVRSKDGEKLAVDVSVSSGVSVFSVSVRFGEYVSPDNVKVRVRVASKEAEELEVSDIVSVSVEVEFWVAVVLRTSVMVFVRAVRD